MLLLNEVYKCRVCGSVVNVTCEGNRKGHLVCCNKSMSIQVGDKAPKEEIRNQVVKTIIGLVSDVTSIDIEKISLDTELDYFGFDSLDTVELVMAFEDEFNIVLTDDEFDSIKTVGDAVKCVQLKL